MTNTLDESEIEDDLPSSILAEIEKFDFQELGRAKGEIRRKRHQLNIRRNIENWTERKIMRDQIDYLD